MRPFKILAILAFLTNYLFATTPILESIYQCKDIKCLEKRYNDYYLTDETIAKGIRNKIILLILNDKKNIKHIMKSKMIKDEKIKKIVFHLYKLDKKQNKSVKKVLKTKTHIHKKIFKRKKRRKKTKKKNYRKLSYYTIDKYISKGYFFKKTKYLKKVERTYINNKNYIEKLFKKTGKNHLEFQYLLLAKYSKAMSFMLKKNIDFIKANRYKKLKKDNSIDEQFKQILNAVTVETIQQNRQNYYDLLDFIISNNLKSKNAILLIKKIQNMKNLFSAKEKLYFMEKLANNNYNFPYSKWNTDLRILPLRQRFHIYETTKIISVLTPLEKVFFYIYKKAKILMIFVLFAFIVIFYDNIFISKLQRSSKWQ